MALVVTQVYFIIIDCVAAAIIVLISIEAKINIYRLPLVGVVDIWRPFVDKLTAVEAHDRTSS